MKKFVLPGVFISIILCACNTTHKKLHEKIAGTDSIAINYFKGDGSMDTVLAVKIIRDKKEVVQLTDLITASSTSLQDDCGYDGSIHFFKNNAVLQDIYFRMQGDRCSQFTFLLNGNRAATALSADAKKMLEEWKK